MTEPGIGMALGSTFCRLGDLAYNLEQISAFAGEARLAGSDILLTPELSATGYGPYPEVIALAEKPGDGPVYAGLASIAKNSGVAIAAGFVEKHEHGPGISHYVVFPSGDFITQRKYRATLFESPLQSAIAGRPQVEPDSKILDFKLMDFPVFEIAGLQCACVICADFQIEGLDSHFDQLGIRVVFLPTGAGGDVRERTRSADLETEEGRLKYLRVLGKGYFPSPENFIDCVTRRRALAAVNQTGWDGRKCSHIGDGSVISPRGEMPVFLYGMHNLDFQRPVFGAGRIPLSHFA